MANVASFVKERLHGMQLAINSLSDASIDAAEARHEQNMENVADAKAKLEERLRAKTEEVETQIEEWKTNREFSKLEKRADKSEEYAAAAIALACTRDTAEIRRTAHSHSFR